MAKHDTPPPELPLGIEPGKPPHQEIVTGGDRPGLRVGEVDGMVRRADNQLAARPDLVRDADGLTERERRFVDLLIHGDPETGERLKPGRAYALAYKNQSSPAVAAGEAVKVMRNPRVLAAIQAAAATLAVAHGLPGLVTEVVEGVLAAELASIQHHRERNTLREYEPSRSAAAFAALAIGLAGIKAPDRLQVEHTDQDGLRERMERGRERAERRLAPLLDGIAEAIEPPGGEGRE